MKCIACGKELLSGGMIASIDGDSVCDQKCKDLLKRQMDYLCTEVFPDEGRTADFILGKEDYPRGLRGGE